MLRVYKRDETDFTHNGVILNNAKHVKVTRELNGEYKLSFNLPADDGKWGALKQRNIVLCEGQRFIITRKSRQKKGTLTREVECLHVISEAGRGHIPLFSDMLGVTPREIMVTAFHGTKFEVMTEQEVKALGMEWVSDITDLLDASKVTPIEIVKRLIENLQKGELYVDNYKIALVERTGVDLNVTHTLSNNLKSIGDIEDGEGIITRLYAYGKDDLPLPNETGYIDSPEGIALFGVISDYIDYDTEDPDELMQKAQFEFSPDNPMRKDMPDVSCTIGLLELYKLHGSKFKVSIGDGLKLDNGQLGIKTTMRIVKYEYYPYSAEESTVTLGRPPKTYVDMLKDLSSSSQKYSKTVDSQGKLKAEWLDIIREKTQTEINTMMVNAVVQDRATIYLDNLQNPTKAQIIGPMGYAVANARKPNGDWDWRTIGTADRFIADEVDAKWIYAGSLTAGQVNAIYGIHLGLGASIDWSLVDAPSAAQVGAKPYDWIPGVTDVAGLSPRLTYIDLFGIYTGTLTAEQVNAIYGIRLGLGASIDWNYMNTPNAEQVGALPKTYINEYGVWTGYMDAGRVNTGSMSANRIFGGTLQGVEININKNASIGEWLYLNSASFNSGVSWSNGYNRVYAEPNTGHMYIQGTDIHFQTSNGTYDASNMFSYTGAGLSSWQNRVFVNSGWGIYADEAGTRVYTPEVDQRYCRNYGSQKVSLQVTYYNSAYHLEVYADGVFRGSTLLT